MANAQQVFRQKAPGIMNRLMADFPVLDIEDAAAILGNLGHECLGFTKLQELNPTVSGSRGGYGWPQWTGPRRRAYEAYCKRNGKDPASDGANYAYLWVELSGIEGSEKNAIPRTVAAGSLNGKVEAFERAFLRAGVKHYRSRKEWAALAMEAYAGNPDAVFDTGAPKAAPGRSVPKNQQRAPWAALVAVVAALIAAVVMRLTGFDISTLIGGA